MNWKYFINIFTFLSLWLYLLRISKSARFDSTAFHLRWYEIHINISSPLRLPLGRNGYVLLSQSHQPLINRLIKREKQNCAAATETTVVDNNVDDNVRWWAPVPVLRDSINQIDCITLSCLANAHTNAASSGRKFFHFTVHRRMYMWNPNVYTSAVHTFTCAFNSWLILNRSAHSFASHTEPDRTSSNRPRSPRHEGFQSPVFVSSCGTCSRMFCFIQMEFLNDTKSQRYFLYQRNTDRHTERKRWTDIVEWRPLWAADKAVKLSSRCRDTFGQIEIGKSADGYSVYGWSALSLAAVSSAKRRRDEFVIQQNDSN